MGQYFKFVNIETEEINGYGLSFNGDLSCGRNIPDYDATDILYMFMEVASKNQWTLDQIVAVGDYDAVVYLSESFTSHTKDFSAEDIIVIDTEDYTNDLNFVSAYES